MSQDSFCRTLSGLGALLFLIGALWAFVLPEFAPDRSVAAYFAAQPLPDLLGPAKLLGLLGSPPALALTLLLFLLPLLMDRRRRDALFLLFAVAGTALIDSVFKSIIDRPRPPLRLIEISSPAFPSWHSATSAALALSLWLLFIRPLPSRTTKGLFGFLLLLWPLAIGSSRLVLNAHWATDVIAGWGVGIFVSCTLFLMTRSREPNSVHS
ncbi:phosphatase PAP2 family protein [Nitratifractor sp.]